MNAVVIAVALMLVLSLLRVHVVVSLIIGAVAGGLLAGLGIESTLAAFNKGLGGGATVALSYALLGAFAVAISKSGVANALAEKILKMIGQKEGKGTEAVNFFTKYSADSYRLYSAAGATAAICDGPFTAGSPLSGLCVDVRFDYPLHVFAGGLWWYFS